MKLNRAFLFVRISFFLILACLTHHLEAQGALSEQSLDFLKSITVFVKARVGQNEATGSGFIVRTQGQIGYVVTNEHVVRIPGNTSPVISAVLNSGTEQERSMPCNVIATDTDRDLAILKIQAKSLPQSVNLTAAVKIRETLPVYIFGFPFGEALATTEKSPAITVGKGSISSIRKTESGKIIQIDGDLNPGNSGGPIVDENGAVIGIAVAKVGGTQIAFVIPFEEIFEMFAGRIQSVKFDKIRTFSGPIKYRADVSLIDPFANLKRVSILYITARDVHSRTKEDSGNWKPVAPAMTEQPLTITGQNAVGELTFSNPTASSTYLYQVKQVSADGKISYTKAVPVQIEPGHQGVTSVPTFQNTMTRQGERHYAASKEEGWLGSKPPTNKSLSAIVIKDPVSGSGDFLGTKRTLDNLSVMEASLPSAQAITSMLFSSDSKFIYISEKNGTVRKISIPGFLEDRRLETGERISGLEFSKSGLLLALNELQEIWILDPATLKVKSRINVPNLDQIASSPSLSLAYATPGSVTVLYVIDLISGTILKQYEVGKVNSAQGASIRKHLQGVNLNSFAWIKVTPDGKYLFCSGYEALHRFQIRGSDIVYEEMGPKLSGSGPIVISPDSMYVSLVGGSGRNISDHPKIEYGSYIYKVSDISTPVLSIETGMIQKAIGFDKIAGRIYSQNNDKQLLIFNTKGVREKEYAISRYQGDRVRSFAVYPLGSKLLVLTDGRLYWVEIQK